MATVSETGTFPGDIQLWQTPMRADNTPKGNPAAPIGRITWFNSKVTAAKITTNVVELAVAVTVPTERFAYRLMNASWGMQVTDADAIADTQDWHDQALLTVPIVGHDGLSINLNKPSASLQATITNLFVYLGFTPGATNGNQVSLRQQFQDPFIPASPMIFRCVNTTANASAAMTWFSHMWAYMYTIEQYNQGYLWSQNPIGNE